MTTDTTKTSILAGKLTKTHFATEQERLEEFARAMAVSTQAGESLKGADGKDGADGTSGPPGPAGQDGETPQALTRIAEVPNGEGSTTPVVITGLSSPDDTGLKLVWTGSVAPVADRYIAYCQITASDELTVYLDDDTGEEGWSVYATYWEATP